MMNIEDKNYNYQVMRHFKLTEREFDCLVLTIYGLSIKHVAKLIGISDRTVEVHLKTLRVKLGISAKNEISMKLRQHNPDYVSECNQHFILLSDHT